MSNSNEFLAGEQRPQWDAFFRRLAPHCGAFRAVLQSALWPGKKDPPDLSVDYVLPTELPSLRVAQALHGDDRFKALRADSIYMPVSGEPVIAYEFQSTWNEGIRLRFAMYQEAMTENASTLKLTRRPRAALVYSGNPRRKLRQLHGCLMWGYIPYVLICLDAMDSSEFKRDTFEGRIIGLARRKGPTLEDFDALRMVIERLPLSDRRTMLLTTLVMASFNKPSIAEVIARRWTMDDELAKGLSVFLPEFQRRVIEARVSKVQKEAEIEVSRIKREAAEKRREDIIRFVVIMDGPKSFIEIIQLANEKDLDGLMLKAAEYVKLNWSTYSSIDYGHG